MNNKKLLEERLNQIAKSLDSMEGFINNLDIEIPDIAKKVIEKTLYSDEIKEIVNGINQKRPPRLALIGRSGVGKSSLINAITGSYLAETSAVNVGTSNAELFQYKKDGEIIFEIIDTRGIKENIQVASNTAEEDLVKAIYEFEPDAFLMLNNGSDRTTLKEDMLLLKKLSEEINVDIPLVTVITRVDALPPARIKTIDKYTKIKLNHIQEKVNQAEAVIKEVDIKNSKVIPVSSYIEWTHESPEALTEEEQAKLEIEFDGRYNIDTLIEYLEENIDFRAAVHMMLHHRIDQAIKKISERFVKMFSAVSATIALTPIPISDVFVLVPIQLVQVNLIAYLNGIKLDAKAARDFIMSLGGVTLIGLGFRFAAQQGAKYLNVIVPVGGSVISSAIASSGTYAIGQAAIMYYIDGKSEEEVIEGVKTLENNKISSSKVKQLEVKEKEIPGNDESQINEEIEPKDDQKDEEVNQYNNVKNKVTGFLKGFIDKKMKNN